MDWEVPLESFGGITAREAAELCYQCHKSQHKYNYTVGYKEKWDCRQFGLYRSLVGNDTKADFMDNIQPLPKPQETEEATQTEPTETTGISENVSLTAAADTNTQAVDKEKTDTALIEIESFKEEKSDGVIKKNLAWIIAIGATLAVAVIAGVYIKNGRK